MKIFGREPAFWVGVLVALVSVLVTFHFDGLSTEQAGAVSAVIIAVGGVLTAWATRDTALAALVAAAKAILVLAVAYHFTVSEETIGAITAFVSILGSGWLRTQTSPVETAVSNA